MRYKSVKEKTLFIDLPGTNMVRIKGILRGSLDQPLAVMMHGRPGNGNALLQYLGARYLHEHGIASLRLFMYDFEPQTRNLLDCTLQTHADDFDTVVAYLREQKVPHIFGIGHSYGGITILKSTAKLDGAVLWDPTHGSWWAEGRDALSAKMYPLETVGKYVIGTAGPCYVDCSVEGAAYDQRMGDTTHWASGKGYPLSVISAGEGKLTDLGARYIEAAEPPKQQITIPGAHHSFNDSDEVVQQLFSATATWLKGIIKTASL